MYRHFAYAYSVFDLYKSQNESLEMWMGWIQEGAICFPSTLNPNWSYHRENKKLQVKQNDKSYTFIEKV